MTYNRFIGSAPIFMPLLIVAALVFVNWYRPTPSANPLDWKAAAESLRAIAHKAD